MAEMNENEKKTTTATAAATKTSKESVAQKKFTQSDLEAAVQAATEKAVAEALKAQQEHFAAQLAEQKKAFEAAAAQQQGAATVIQVEKQEYVTIVFFGRMSKGTVVYMPKWGTITYAGGMLDIPKKDFLQGLGIQVNDSLLKKRAVIVINGLNEDEMVRFNLRYRDGEVLSVTDFETLFSLPQERIVELYKKLGAEHKKLVAQMYLDAYFERHEVLDIKTVRKLNALSRTVDKDGLFKAILKDIGQRMPIDDDLEIDG